MHNNTTESKPRIQRFSDLLGELETWGDKKHEAVQSGKALGPQIASFPRLSELIGGHLSYGILSLSAVPGAGKTGLANQLAAGAGCPALIVSTEMSGMELLIRQIARVTKRPLGKLRSGNLTGRELRALGKATAEAMPQLCVIDATSTTISAAEIQAEVRDLRDDAGRMLLVVDSVHSWARRNVEAANEYDRVTQATNTFERLAHAEKIAILLVTERSRATMQSGGLHAGKGSASIEYASRHVWSLDVQGDGERDAQGSVSVRLHIAKNKDGPTGGSIGFRFFPDFMRFEEVG